MPFATNAVDRVLHLLIFVAAAGVIGVVALAALERLTDGAQRSVRLRHVLIPAIPLLVVVAIERVYHALA